MTIKLTIQNPVTKGYKHLVASMLIFGLISGCQTLKTNPPSTPENKTDLSVTVGASVEVSAAETLSPVDDAVYVGSIASQEEIVQYEEIPASAEPGLLDQALALLGTPYRWGGTTPEGGFDCSGYIQYVYRNATGINLPRTTNQMFASQSIVPVDREELVPGDLVFFRTRGRAAVNHAGIYLGGDQFVHAPRTGKNVSISDLNNSFWRSKFVRGRRVM